MAKEIWKPVPGIVRRSRFTELQHKQHGDKPYKFEEALISVLCKIGNELIVLNERIEAIDEKLPMAGKGF